MYVCMYIRIGDIILSFILRILLQTDDAGAIEVVVDHAEILNQINGILPFAPHSKGLMVK